MPSAKKLNSKGKAGPFSPVYELRKRQFADLPEAKLIRPLRALRASAADSFDTLQLALRLCNHDETAAPVQKARADFMFRRTLAAVGRKLADRGRGVELHNFAVRHLA